MNNITKNIIIGVLAVVVLILSIMGISKYKKNNSIDINFGIGNHGIGSGRYKDTGGGINIGGGGKSKTKKGNFIKCIAYEDSLKATGYFEFRNGVLYHMMQYEISGEVPADYMKEHTKKEVENELSSMLCSRKKSSCGNVKFSWSGRKVTMTLGVDINVMTSSMFKTGMSESEFLSSMSEDKGTTCEKVSKAPIYATKVNSSSYSESGENYNIGISEKKYEDSTTSAKDIKDAVAESKATVKEINQKSAEDSASNISVKQNDRVTSSNIVNMVKQSTPTNGTLTTRNVTCDNGATLVVGVDKPTYNGDVSTANIHITNTSNQTCNVKTINITYYKNSTAQSRVPFNMSAGNIKAGFTYNYKASVYFDISPSDSVNIRLDNA